MLEQNESGNGPVTRFVHLTCALITGAHVTAATKGGVGLGASVSKDVENHPLAIRLMVLTDGKILENGVLRKMECKSLEEVRRNIDRSDAQIVKLIAERGVYVKQASQFKKDRRDVQAPQRVEAIIQKVRALATEYGTSPDIVEKLYREMIAGFIELEMKEWHAANDDLQLTLSFAKEGEAKVI